MAEATNGVLGAENVVSSAAENGDDERSPSPQFKPLVDAQTLPVTEGAQEVEEEVLLNLRAKLWRMHDDGEEREWKERGVGTLKVLEHKSNSTLRVLMRRDKTFKVCANHLITPYMRLEKLKEKNNFFIYKTYADQSDDGEAKPETFLIKFINGDEAKEFQEVFEMARDVLKDIEADPTPAKRAEEEILSKEESSASELDEFSGKDEKLSPEEEEAAAAYSAASKSDELKKYVNKVTGRGGEQKTEPTSQEVEFLRKTLVNGMKKKRNSTKLKRLIACRQGHVNVVNCLLRYGASVTHFASENYWTAFHEAACSKKPEPVLELLLAQPDAASGANAVDKYGMCPLHYAILANSLDAAKILVEQFKVALDAGRQNGYWTPVRMAANFNRQPLASFLLKRGALVEDVDIAGGVYDLIPDKDVIEAGNISLLKRLLERDPRNAASLLKFAASTGRVDPIFCLREFCDLTYEDVEESSKAAKDAGHDNCYELLCSRYKWQFSEESPAQKSRGGGDNAPHSGRRKSSLFPRKSNKGSLASENGDVAKLSGFSDLRDKANEPTAPAPPLFAKRDMKRRPISPSLSASLAVTKMEDEVDEPMLNRSISSHLQSLNLERGGSTTLPNRRRSVMGPSFSNLPPYTPPPDSPSLGDEDLADALQCSRTVARRAFQWLISPQSVDKFLEKNWEKRPVLIRRHRPDYYKNLLSCKDIDRALRRKNVFFEKNLDITIYEGGERQTHTPAGRAVAHVVWDYFRNGCSVRMLNPQTFFQSVWKLNSVLAEYFNSFVGANVYLTPAGTQGFAPHFDDIEAFLLPAALERAMKENVEFRESLPLDYSQVAGLVNAERFQTDESRIKFFDRLHSLIAKLPTYAPIDAVVDEHAKRLIKESLPPLLSEGEKACSIFGIRAGPTEDGDWYPCVELESDTEVRLIRHGCCRVVEEGDKFILYYTIENSREYEQWEPGYLELAKCYLNGVIFLTHSYPEYIAIKDLPLRSKRQERRAGRREEKSRQPREENERTYRIASGSVTGRTKQRASCPTFMAYVVDVDDLKSCELAVSPHHCTPDMTTSASRTKHVDFQEKGESKQKREKYLTAKYGAHQMSLIRKRLAVENWMFDEIQELFGESESSNDRYADIDLDEILDLENDEERRQRLHALWLFNDPLVCLTFVEEGEIEESEEHDGSGVPHVPYTPNRYLEEEMQKRANDFFRLMNGRRTVRQYSEQDVPQELVELLIKTAGSSPSGANMQPWTFVVVRDKLIKKYIRRIVEAEEEINYKRRMGKTWLKDLEKFRTNWEKPYLEKAPVLILIFKQNYGVAADGSRITHYYQEISVSLATGILLAAIQNAGLCTLTSTPMNCGPALRTLLKRPDNEKLILLLPLGYAAEDATVPDLKRKSLDEFMIDCSDRNIQRLFTEITWDDTDELELLFNNNEITTVPTLPEMPVVSLSLNHNKIVNVSDEAFKNLKLSHLDLSHNRLTRDSLSKQSFANRLSFSDYEQLHLQRLDLSWNLIHSFDKDVFDHLEELEELIMAHNPMPEVDVSTAIALTTIRDLKVLDFSGTEMVEFPESILHSVNRLEKLYLRDNLFTKVPTQLSSTHTLLELYLDNNPIERLEYDSFQDLESLKLLSISGMPLLKNIGTRAFAQLDDLETLICSFNPSLSSIHPFAFRNKDGDRLGNLKKVDLNNNRLETVSATLLDWTQLDSVNLQENPWRCDCNLRWMVTILGPYLEKNAPQLTMSITCALPKEFHAQNALMLAPNDFKCVHHIPNLSDLTGSVHKDSRRAASGAMATLVIIAIILSIMVSGGIVYYMMKRRKYQTERQGVKYTRTVNEEMPPHSGTPIDL
ncbi:unnamed protein product [Cyprideis torosa]|uniref:[histone H3]-dimethyl-L-lysine(36) demethylase n=1 Tax=Cyprideis torosa TaxID=163714 RepID=A0A7R8ZFX1_9CRUS|nr:unnamed protein product [Cyprideis torosa]CAG0880137.1 unnamed protein product [Cyprideis torosa]